MTKPDNLVADWSYLHDLEWCPRLFQYRHELGYRPNEPSWRMITGSAVHAGLRVLYTKGFEAVAEAMEAARAVWNGVPFPGPTSDWGFMGPGHSAVVVQNYAEDRKADPWEVINLADHGIVVERPVVSDALGYGGIPDLAVEIEGLYYIVDHKSTAEWVTTWWAAKHRISHQFKGYALLLQGRLGVQFSGAILNGVYMGAKAGEPISAWAKRTSVRSGWFGPFTFDQSLLAETEEWVRQRKAEIQWRREAQSWPQHTYDCGSCEFLQVCERPPVARAALLRKNFVVRERYGVLASGADADHAKHTEVQNG